MFVNLHQHSMYSVGDGYATLDENIERAKECGYNAVALTDHGTTTGLFSHYMKCKENNIKPILGMEGYFCEDPDIKEGNSFHILLLAKNLTGLHNLYSLSTYGGEHFYKKPRIGLKALEQYKDGIIVASACVSGIMNMPDCDDTIVRLKEIFGDDFYLELQPHKFQAQYDLNKKVIKYSKRYNIPMIVTLDSHYARPEDCKYHDYWVSLRNVHYSSDDFYIDNEENVRRRLRDVAITDDIIDSSIRCVEEIVDKCNVEIPLGGDNYPKYPSDNLERTIRDWCNEGWRKHQLYKLRNKNEYIERVNKEIPILKRCDYLNYLCIIRDILDYCRSSNILYGVGRGSVGGSLVAYLLGLTNVDSIRYGTIFERFCNEQRVTPADIDTDLESDHRDDVIEYIKSRYGQVYHVRTMNYMQEKGAIKRAGQALDITPSLVNKITTNFQSWDDVKDKKLRDVAEHFYGRIQSYGSHASAIMVFPSDPCQWCSIEKQGDIMVCATDYHDLEKQGCLKLDILGLTNLSIVHHIADMMDKNVFDFWDSVPDRDMFTSVMLSNGRSDGCFQIESNTMKDFLRNIKPRSIDDMSVVVALCRPGPLDSGMAKDYLERRANNVRRPYKYQPLNDLLEDTYGVILYQEQVMQIAQKLCGYSLGEADILRKIIGRKIVEEMEPAMKEFRERGIKHGTPKDVIDYLADSISKSANYLFNKSHSIAYGMTSWRTAWIKARHTGYFYAATIDYNVDDRASMSKYISLAEKNFEVGRPDTILGNKSCMFLTRDGKHGTIVLGFNVLKYVDPDSFVYGQSGFDFINNNKTINKRALQSVVKSGAAGSNRCELLEYIDYVKDKRKSKGEFKYAGVYNETSTQMELDSIGYSFSVPSNDYDTSICDNVSTYLVIVTKKKAHKTKSGKPMHFIGGIVNNTPKELVIFDNKGTGIEVGKAYIMRLNGTIISDYTEAQRK